MLSSHWPVNSPDAVTMSRCSIHGIIDTGHASSSVLQYREHAMHTRLLHCQEHAYVLGLKINILVYYRAALHTRLLWAHICMLSKRKKKKDILKNGQPQSCTIQSVFLSETKGRPVFLCPHPTISLCSQGRLAACKRNTQATGQLPAACDLGVFSTSSCSLGTGRRGFPANPRPPAPRG